MNTTARTIDKFNGYTLTRTNHGTWKIEGDNNGHVRIDTAATIDWENRTTTTEVFVNIVSTGAIAPDEAANMADEIMRASQTAKYFTDVIAKLEAEQVA